MLKIIDNRYKILKTCGTGATGTVYKVRDLKDNKILALKMLSKKKTSSEAVRRFKREFKLLAGLRHPNLCSVYDFGALRDGRSYFTMEYVDGEDIFNASKGLSYKKVYPWIVQLCRILEYIHSRGLIHYDIKPGNVLIQKSEDASCVKLMDFGLVGEQRIKEGILIKGTLPYIAPEVIKGLVVDHRADLYSLGVLLYEIFTRKALYMRKKMTFVALLNLQRKLVSTPPSKIVAGVPKLLERLIMRLLSFEPAARFSHAHEVIKDINKISRLKFEFETEQTLESYLLSSRFVGREKEMSLLKSFYEKARCGEGSAILITGEAGIGKSRLLKEFKIFTQLRRSYCFTGYAHKDKIIPLEPFYDIFSELINYIKKSSAPFRFKKRKLTLAVLFKIFPDLADGHLRRNLPKLVPLEPKQEKLRAFGALFDLIGYCASSLGELVILLEDLHWADDLSIQFLEYLGRNIADKNVFICGTSRSEELKENQVLKRMMINLRNEGFLTQIELKPLKFKNLYSFLDSTITPDCNSFELARYLMKKTGGNPFFVEEIIRTLLRKKKISIGERMELKDLKQIAIPGTIEDVVLKRIKDLDRDSRKVVRIAAILLKGFSYDLVKRLTSLDDTELSRALWRLKNRQVLIEKDNEYRFYHATLRDVVNKRMAYREKRKLYYQTGKTLELIYKSNIERVVEDLAYYFINAKDSKKGVKYGFQAAQKSSKRYANEQAIRFYEGVLALLDDKKLRLQFNTLQKLAEIEVHADLYDDAIKHYTKALNLKTGPIDKKVMICSKIGSIHDHKAEFRKALQIYRRAIGLLRKMKIKRVKAPLEADINVRMCRVYYMIGDYKRANKFNFNDLEFPKGKLKGKEAIGLQGSIYNTLALIETIKGGHSQVHCDIAISYYKKAYKYFKMIKNEGRMTSILNNLGVMYRRKFDSRSALDCYQRTVKISEKRGFQHQLSTGLYNLGNCFLDSGDYSKALGYFQRAFSISKKVSYPSMTSVSLLGIGRCYIMLCEYRKSHDYHEKALSILETIGWKEHKVTAFNYMADIHQALGNYTTALRFYKKALKISKDIKYQPGIALLLLNIGKLFLEIGAFPKAKRYIKNSMKISIEQRILKIDCYVAMCRFNMMTRNYAVAKDYYKKGITMTKESGMRRQSIHFFLLRSEIYYHEKMYSKGTTIANKAIKLAEAMGIKDLYVEALLLKVKNGVKHSVLLKKEAIKILKKAKRIAEEISRPEVLWKVYFEYGRLLHDNEQYYMALGYYRECVRVFRDVINKIKNESYKRQYLDHPDRQAAIEHLLLLLPQFRIYLEKD